MQRRKHVQFSWLWRWHNLLVGFVAFAGIGMALAAAYFTVPGSQSVLASGSENVVGWVWADPIGWISLNDSNLDSGGGSYGVNVDLTTGLMNGFGWSENAGWVCFGNSCAHPDCAGSVPPSSPRYQSYSAELLPPPLQAGDTVRNFHGWAKVCNEGEAGWISLNCEDPAPSACGIYAYRVPYDMSTHYFEDSNAGGSPSNGTSFAWNGNTDESGFGYIDFHLAALTVPPENTDLVCADNLDNDTDGAIDCADNDCSLTVPCAPPPPDLTEDQCPLGTADLCCSDNVDNEGDGPRDCDDSDCRGTSSMCTVAWLKTSYGNVYAQKGIESIAAPAAQYNATYCLSYTDGRVVGFASQADCLVSSSALSLPNSSEGYKGSLGSIDVIGIENGRYGAVQQIADGSALPNTLDGKIYIYSGGGTLVLPAKNFQNGMGQTGRGNGLLFVKGADLTISANMSYAAPVIQDYLRNLSSFGVIVTRDPLTGAGGHIYIDPNVDTVVGAYFAETAIESGVSARPLTVYGLMASRQLVFGRTGGTAETAAETVIFDGRAVANPPPGMQDIGKSLPKTKDAF